MIDEFISTYQDGGMVYLESKEKDEIIEYIIKMKESLYKLTSLLNHSNLTMEEMERVGELLNL